ncbi:MAG: hypothetical protein NTV00_07020 [Methylococcales bacterium]|nr:hypothetical protein [Methylococcales bacterium]
MWKIASNFVLILIVTGVTPTLAQAEVFIMNPLSEKPCEIVANVKTTDKALVKLVKKYGAKARIVQPATSIKESGQRVAMIELPTKNGSMLFSIMEGTQEQCYDSISSMRTKLDIQESPYDLQPSANWIRVGGIPDGSRTDYVDSRSIWTDEFGLIRLWVKQKYIVLQKAPNGARFISAKFSLALNCHDHTTAVTALGYYDKNDNVVQHVETERSQWSFTEPPPESMPNVLLRSHC